MKKLENAFKVAEHTDAMLAFWDKDLVCRFANSSYIKWFGMSPADMIDRITLPVLLGPLYEQNFPFINNALQGKVQVFERDIQLPNGELKNTIATYTPEIRDGVVIGFYAHVADVTPVKNESIKVKEYVEDYTGMTVGHNYLNGVEHTLRTSLFTKFPGLQVLAKQYFISPTKLKKDFKARYNSTIFSYYRALQMQVADKYIREKIYSKKQLAEMFGFDNQSNFANCYKKYTAGKTYLKPLERSFYGVIGDPGIETAHSKSEISLPPDSIKWEEEYKRLADQFKVIRECFEHLHIGTWERNFETSQTTWNSAAKEILELPPEFEPNMTPALHFYKEGGTREFAKKCLHEAFTTGKNFDFQAQLITARGNEKTVRVSGFCQFENNACKKMYGTFQEIF